MTQIDKIKAEIERLMNWKPKAIPSGMRQRDVLNIRKGVLLTLKAFINSLPAEQPSEELEEAFDEVLPNPNWYISNDGEDAYNVKQMEEMFCAGANWQKEQLINKACEWLRRCVDVDDEVKMINGEPEAESFIQKNIHRIKVTNQLVEDFKKAMEK